MQQVSCKGHNWTIICCQSYCTAEDNSGGTILKMTKPNKYLLFLLHGPEKGGARDENSSYKQKLQDIELATQSGKSNKTIFNSGR